MVIPFKLFVPALTFLNFEGSPDEVEVALEPLACVKTCGFKYSEYDLVHLQRIANGNDNFSPANKIGEGGFGCVYKGRLKDGIVAAIKVLSADSRQGMREFLAEIKLIADVEHDNLVKLYGCCVEENHRILVYGYLENNSLAQTLLGGKHISIQFSWPARCKICKGVAQGLAFLHEEVQPHIVHRDIKASNILLDRDLMPKISDFGLAKLFPANMTHISTHVAGTAFVHSPKTVYSTVVFVCGMHSVQDRGYRHLNMLFEAWEMHVKGELVSLVDTSLNGDFDTEEACRYMKIGLLCTQDKPKLRPTMSTVVRMLKGEIDLKDDNISSPGLLSELMGIKRDKGHR
ncbi:hypothetical protein GH714_010403 [Hevea brasiliensis]|uniref:non-specific serine/threonine protein kinase n=1 Tax=Hevea brasiliensis TaxID=3981 RepID=A0A6A6KBE2_HEVBR|nr:hypothetical protein GH714_010403 [Hevea brasiliensis]